ncbi:MAG: AAA family ATPase [Nanoarchaeota archaeon]
MILRYLKLHNIRSYLNEKIDFPEGSVLLCGDIGSGKSTVLLAIEFALFGLKRGEFTGASLLRNGESFGSVELKFSLELGKDVKDVVVHRELKRGQNSIKQDSGFLIIDGQRMEGTSQELKSVILQLLGYPEALLSKSKDMIYRYTVYTPQEAMKQIIFADKEQRLDTLRRVFNIDKYKRVRENLSVVSRKMRENLKLYEGMIASLPEKSKLHRSIVREANQVTRDIKALIPSIKEVNSKIEEKSTLLETTQEKLVKYKEIEQKRIYSEKELNALSDQKKKMIEEKENLEKSISELDSKQKLLDVGDFDEKELEDAQSDLDSFSNEYNEKMTSNSVLKEKISSMREYINRLSKETKSKKFLEKIVFEKKQELKNAEVIVKQKTEIEKNITKVEKIISDLHNKITECGVKYASSEKIITDIAELSDCPTCKQKVTDEYKKEIIYSHKKAMKKIKAESEEYRQSLKGYEERLSKSKENLNSIVDKESEISRIKAELENAETNLKEYDAKCKELEELEKKQDHFKSKVVDDKTLNEYKKTLSDKKSHCDELRKKLSMVKERKYVLESIEEKHKRISELDVNPINQKISELKKEISELDKSIKESKSVVDELDKLKKEMTDLEKKRSELNEKKVSLVSTREGLIKQKENLEIEIAKMREYKERMSYISEIKTWLAEYFSEMTVIMEKKVMVRLLNEFNDLFREWFNILIEDETINVRLNEEFTPVVEQNGYEIDVTDLSGGEKTSCALAYRLALNKVINDCIDVINTKDLIILDEPTDGFSSEQLDRLRDVLEMINMRQVIIVSHEAKIESFVENIIRINKSEHVSSVT